MKIVSRTLCFYVDASGPVDVVKSYYIFYLNGYIFLFSFSSINKYVVCLSIKKKYEFFISF